jgi:hypothetical protein
MTPSIPHLRVIIGVCIVAVAGYAVFSAYAVIWLRDATMTGDVIGTWKSFAVAAFAFWLGSSSGGKAKDPGPVPQDAAQAARQTANAADEQATRIEGVTQ